jgi:hypothetical protein
MYDQRIQPYLFLKYRDCLVYEVIHLPEYRKRGAISLLKTQRTPVGIPKSGCR